jgi:hypothetical protein
MALLETHVRPACVGIGASGLSRLASRRESPGKLKIVVPSVKKSMYFEPTTCTRFSAGFPLAPLTDEVAESLAVDVALSVECTVVVEAASAAASVLGASETGVELAVSARIIAGSASVAVASVVVAVRAATTPVFKVPTMKRLVRRTLATENARTLFFIRLG